ncbi:DUF3037 domain-containing protein [Streptosporangiaceae bacterium NEAU-GS5]|nr:DUF3037 domain-containing protein [Streptosporangiaceae bacterium NEAU-GS5]
MIVYEYAVIRVVPSIERGELVNVGVIVYCQPRDFLCARVELDEPRLRALAGDLDLPQIRHALTAYEMTCDDENRGALGARFRWLTAPRSTVVQPGPVHAGLTPDPAAELDRLMDRLVL